MDYLQEGIGLRAMAQKDPLVEYQREGYTLFTAMMESIKEESIGYLFNVEVEVAEPVADDEAPLELAPQEFVPLAPVISAKGLAPQRSERLEYTAPSIDGEGGVVHAAEDLDEVPELGPDASRAERRRAERAARKRDERKR